ncbi:hypothetical protein CWI38_1458p0030 [Hamiltosporidium tvaerminnensis]|uniref:Uncharacterized protein n=1 Tax=Hamiltosporidium tvaerminnensis TaxID=1176355 RepID=A0A4Q9LTR9_9MICR|nr:hypothetical protein CWI38_1458p0030 [Hamiltosporidium tvaerminnensis]
MRKNKITHIEVGITSQYSVHTVKTEKLRNYGLVENEEYSYVMTWDGIVTEYNKKYTKRLQIPMNVEAYIQSIVLKETAVMHKQLKLFLKQVDNEEAGVKTENTKNITSHMSEGGTTL